MFLLTYKFLFNDNLNFYIKKNYELKNNLNIKLNMIVNNFEIKF